MRREEKYNVGMFKEFHEHNNTNTSESEYKLYIHDTD